jgi:hypothetical protein
MSELRCESPPTRRPASDLVEQGIRRLGLALSPPPLLRRACPVLAPAMRTPEQGSALLQPGLDVLQQGLLAWG